MEERARVLMLLTGGTLASVPSSSGALEPKAFAEQLATTLPELAQIADIDTESLMLKDSSDIRPADWRTLAAAIHARYLHYDGFVVVHGTDTMAYTASALSFMLPSLSKPVVFTGSQRPIFEPRSDARVNVVDSVSVAAMDVPEVAVCIHSQLLRGNRCRKRSTSSYRAFESPNYPPLAQLGVKISLSSSVLPPRGVPGLPLPRPLELDERVSLVFLTPTTRPEELRIHRETGTRALVLMSYGAGNLPLEGGVLEEIAALEIPCVVLTQCWEGPIDLELYRGGKALADLGFIDGADMTPEAALTKLMAGLGTGLEGDGLVEYFTNSVAGERRDPVDHNSTRTRRFKAMKRSTTRESTNR